jgi:hypothetical protein
MKRFPTLSRALIAVLLALPRSRRAMVRTTDVSLLFPTVKKLYSVNADRSRTMESRLLHLKALLKALLKARPRALLKARPKVNLLPQRVELQ